MGCGSDADTHELTTHLEPNSAHLTTEFQLASILKVKQWWCQATGYAVIYFMPHHGMPWLSPQTPFRKISEEL